MSGRMRALEERLLELDLLEAPGALERAQLGETRLDRVAARRPAGPRPRGGRRRRPGRAMRMGSAMAR